ncbi:putative membrane protein [Arthrobacter sp. CAN_A212]|uniref:DoxX family protein n=1 Tax=Arthrobacter sp. CAN_A212 TaxID=2787719 RepID=UPI001A197A31
MTDNRDLRPLSPLRTIARIVLGVFLLFAGAAHLFFARAEFAAQVPAWMPLDTDFVVIASGIVELVLGAALVFLPRWRVQIGWIVALFFVAVFPGNIAQYVDRVDAFGLDTDLARLTRLFFQPVLVVWALWSTGAWRGLRSFRRFDRTRDQ